MKKIIAFFKGLFAVSAEPVVTAPVVETVVEEAPKKVARKNVATSPAAIAGTEAPKKKKRYYKPKNKA